MTTVSNTITITNTTYETLASLASITLTEGNSYTLQIQNIADIKIGDAEFTVINKIFPITQTSEDIYIRCTGLPAVVTILENA